MPNISKLRRMKRTSGFQKGHTPHFRWEKTKEEEIHDTPKEVKYVRLDEKFHKLVQNKLLPDQMDVSSDSSSSHPEFRLLRPRPDTGILVDKVAETKTDNWYVFILLAHAVKYECNLS